MTPQRWSVPVAILALSASALVGCSSPPTLNKTAVQAEITRGISEQLGLSVEVDCPGNPTIRQGTVITCIATATGGMKIPVTVTIQDDAGNYVWRTD